MKVPITLLSTLLISMLKAQVLTDSAIIKNNIYQVISIAKSTTKTGSGYSYQTKKILTTYGRNGLPVKIVTVTLDAWNNRDSLITEYFYQDTLLTKITSKEFENRKLIDKGFETYSYTFDSLNRKTSQVMKDYIGRETKEEYTWSPSNKIEAIHYYSNDSAVYIPQRRGYDFLRGKKFQPTTTVRNYWGANNNLLKSVGCAIGCKLHYISDSLCCTSTEYSSNKDTSIQKITFYKGGWQTGFEKEYSMPSGAVYRESERGDKTILFEQKNKKGLLVKRDLYEIRIEGYIVETITTFAYKFNPK